jgi:hypothetical protein
MLNSEERNLNVKEEEMTKPKKHQKIAYRIESFVIWH